MDEDDWAAATRTLDDAADRFAVLSRCLAVTAQLEDWRLTHADLPGGDAANALDQALGDLERLAQGGAAALAQTVQSVLDELPPAWD